MSDARFFPLTKKISVDEVAQIVGAQAPDGAVDLMITDAAQLPHAQSHQVTYADEKSLDSLLQTQAGVCLICEKLAGQAPDGVIELVVEDPKKAFVMVLEALFTKTEATAEIHQTACVSDEATLGENVSLGAYVVIEAGAEVADGAQIGSHSVIGKNVRIGAGSVIGTHVSISYSMIGQGCTIHDGARIGQAGFGFLHEASGHRHIPQIGRVLIEDGANIGANVTIDRGALDDTVIGPGTIIDNGVHIAHNVKIGKGCIIIAQTGISGSSTLGNYVVLAGQVGVADHVSIGDGAQVAAKTGIMSTVNAGEKVMGYPARPIKQFFREMATLKKMSSRKERGK